MIFSNPDKCTECQFEDGEHAPDCSFFEDLDFENENPQDEEGKENAQDLEDWKNEK